MVTVQGAHSGEGSELNVIMKMLRQDGANSMISTVQQRPRHAMQIPVASRMSQQFVAVRKQLLIIIVLAEIGIDLTQTQVGMLRVIQGQTAEEMEDADQKGEHQIEQKSYKGYEKDGEIEGDDCYAGQDKGAS